MTGISEIEKAALNLPLGQRVCLAQSLLDSLPPMPEDLSEAAEIEEVQRRERELETGQAQPLKEAELWRRVAARRQA